MEHCKNYCGGQNHGMFDYMIKANLNQRRIHLRVSVALLNCQM